MFNSLSEKNQSQEICLISQASSPRSFPNSAEIIKNCLLLIDSTIALQTFVPPTFSFSVTQSSTEQPKKTPTPLRKIKLRKQKKESYVLSNCSVKNTHIVQKIVRPAQAKTDLIKLPEPQDDPEQNFFRTQYLKSIYKSPKMKSRKNALTITSQKIKKKFKAPSVLLPTFKIRNDTTLTYLSNPFHTYIKNSHSFSHPHQKNLDFTKKSCLQQIRKQLVPSKGIEIRIQRAEEAIGTKKYLPIIRSISLIN